MHRLNMLKRHIAASETSECQSNDSFTVVDNRTGNTYEMPVTDNTISAKDLQKIKSPDGEVTRYFDPGYMNTVNCRSSIAFIDGEKGILEYRGYSIEELAEKSTFLEVAFLLIYGELPTIQQWKKFNKKVMTHTFHHNELRNMMKSFRYDAHPMGMFVSAMSALSTFHPEANPALAGQN